MADTLAQRVMDALALPWQMAAADKKGKFPMAAMKLVADGSHFDIVPFAAAMTQETLDNIQALRRAAFALAQVAKEPSRTAEDYRRWRRIETLHPAEEPDDALAAARMEGGI